MLFRTCAVGSLALSMLAVAQAGPVEGPFMIASIKLLPAGEAESVHEFSAKFVGGRRACVIVRGDHDLVLPLEITVTGKDGKVVAAEKGSHDIVAALWTPARTAEYKVVVRNHAAYSDYARFEDPNKFTAITIAVR